MIIGYLWSTLLRAIPFGLAISVSPGAAFFGIIQTSLSKGFKSGIFFALGIALSDMLFIALCLWGLSGIMENPQTKVVTSFIGGAVLILYGIYTFFSKKKIVSKRQQEQVLAEAQLPATGRFHILRTISKGFFFNFINPGAWILWLSIMPLSGDNLHQRVFFFLCILCTIFAIDILKSFFSGKIKNNITPNVFFIVNRVIGVIFCALGVFMMVRNMVA